MYNRYIPGDASYTRIEEERPPERPKEAGKGPSIRIPDFLSGKEGLAALFKGGEGSGLSGLLKTLRLDSLDAGDILLLLIILYLLVEGDDLDLVIALGAVLLMGLGES